jgi:hypothetical protein
MTTARARGTTGIVRVMSVLGHALICRHHLGNIEILTTERHSDQVHLCALIVRDLICRHRMSDETLNVSAIVRSHALLNRPLQLLKDKVTPIDFPQVIRVIIVK